MYNKSTDFLMLEITYLVFDFQCQADSHSVQKTKSPKVLQTVYQGPFVFFEGSACRQTNSRCGDTSFARRNHLGILLFLFVL